MSDISSKQTVGQQPAPSRARRSKGAAADGGQHARADGPPEVGLVPGVPEWRTTGTLTALQELVEVSETVPAVVARKAGLSTSELHSLRHLMRGPIGPVDLAKVLGVTSAASSGVVDRLVGHGHAERRSHPGDGRRTEVVITERGRAEVLARMTPMFESLAALDATLSEGDRVVVERYLRGATAAMKNLMT
ncbi:MarR family winged helix-turn-helix transcriptional regulator [Terracoccus sp. 273MFTsu3.1]|uniref:MarR family winged helix-turn-helix transcriptional regulator n=1 Tax=Terracoccus sp. 273MFTsu3.1 TaxID=1172188 RepID=UPI001E30F2B1|nr:MarR family transcriptional regulator [Terracoccus sp. 273MFTsu3.1]